MTNQAPDDIQKQNDEAWSIKDIWSSLLMLLVGIALVVFIVASFRNGYGFVVGCSACLAAAVLLLIGINGVIQSLYGGWKSLWHERDDHMYLHSKNMF